MYNSNETGGSAPTHEVPRDTPPYLPRLRQVVPHCGQPQLPPDVALRHPLVPTMPPSVQKQAAAEQAQENVHNVKIFIEFCTKNF